MLAVAFIEAERPEDALNCARGALHLLSKRTVELLLTMPRAYEPTTNSFSPPSVGGSDLNSSNRGCARLGGEVATPLGVVKEVVVVLVVLVRG